MSRYIDADILIQDTIQEYARSKQYRDAIIRMVNKAPTIEPSADRPQGYWTKTDVATYRCSECGKIQIADDINELNFCCCCGSRNKMMKFATSGKEQTMSDDLIKRSDAIKALGNEPMVWTLEDEYTMGQRSQWRADVTAIESIPSADRPQGEWVRTGRTNIYGGIEVQCSNCGDKVMVQHLEDEWYCRHCGADMGMKGADDEP